MKALVRDLVELARLLRPVRDRWEEVHLQRRHQAPGLLVP